AVTMKMISSTSITSMYGTTLISPISRRRRLPSAMSVSTRAAARGNIALQDRRELLHERVVAQFEAAGLVGVAVVGDDRGYRGNEAHGGGDQRLGDARRDHRERRLLHTAERHEGAHDAPHGAEQAHVRTDRAHGRERGEALLEAL